MIIGIPKEVKVREYRVGVVPAGVVKLIESGHQVLVQQGAGVGSGLNDQSYRQAGAQIVASAQEIYGRSKLIVKVKEPDESEIELIQENQIVYAYLHLAANPRLTQKLLESKCIAVAYETIQQSDGSLPLLRPMSEVAGRMAIQVGAGTLEKENGGKGILLAGVPGVRRGKVTIIGAGVVGINACKMAVGLGAEVDILDIDLHALNSVDDIFPGRVNTLYSDSETIRQSVSKADLVIGAVLIPGARAPQLVQEEIVAQMEDGSVIVDVAVDQGGCIETMEPTNHDNPTFVKHGVVHYGVTNMPGAVAQTSTFALTNTTIDYAINIANMGLNKAVSQDKALALGVNLFRGHVTCRPMANSLSLPHQSLRDLISEC